MLAKNADSPSPIKDDRIPPDTEHELTKGKLALSFSHAISSPMDYGSIRPDPKWREDYLNELGSFVFENYVDNARYCLEKEILTKEEAEKVVKQAEAWLQNEKSYALQEGELIESVSPARRYRINLETSIKVFKESL